METWLLENARVDLRCAGVQSNGTIIAENRPYFRTKDLNWDDHACATYKDAVFNVTHVSAPEWVTGIAPQ